MHNKTTIIFILLLITAVSSGCISTPEFTLEDIEDFIGAPLPAEATDMDFYGVSGIDTLVRVRFTLAPEKLHDFLDTLGIETTFEENYTSFGCPRQDGWTPEAPRTYVGGSGSYADYSRHFEIVVDQSDPTQWVVCLVVFTT